MYAGFSVAIVKPHVTAPGHSGRLIRFPFTSFTARRKSADGFSRASLFEFFTKVLGQGKPAFGPTGQSRSAVVALSEETAPWNRVSATKAPVLSFSPEPAVRGNVFAP